MCGEVLFCDWFLFMSFLVDESDFIDVKEVDVDGMFQFCVFEVSSVKVLGMVQVNVFYMNFFDVEGVVSVMLKFGQIQVIDG